MGRYMENDNVEVLFPIPTLPEDEEDVMSVEVGSENWEEIYSMDSQ